MKGHHTPHTEETKRKISESKMGSIPWNKGLKGIPSGAKGHKWTDEQRAYKSLIHRGCTLSETHKQNIGKTAWKSLTGGNAGNAFARILCPIGFIREHWIRCGKRRFRPDFVELTLKIIIELDGPGHFNNPKYSKEYFEERSRILKEFGWLVIKIKHDKFKEEYPSSYSF